MPDPVFRFEIAYEGGDFHGWQIQKNARTVQGDVEEALSILMGKPMKVFGASRTDAGVHALGQVCSFAVPDDLAHKRDPYVMHRAMTGLLPRDVAVLRVERVDGLDEQGRPFHARHCARGKIYRYRVWSQRVPNPFVRKASYHLRRVPGADGWARAEEAAADFVGEHDFAGFRAADCDSRSTERTIKRVEIQHPQRSGDPVVVEVEGSAFLKNMVRIMVGTLLDVAAGNKPPSVVRDVLRNGDRTQAGQTAPAQGLCLHEVFYPDFPWRRPRWTMPPKL